MMVDENMIPYRKQEFKSYKDSINTALFNKGFIASLKKDNSVLADSIAKNYFNNAVEDNKNTTNMKEIIAALENGQMVISLQHLGHFTRGGHYLLLQRYYPDDDTFQVRDSNIYNYGRLEGHQVDKFTRGNILSGSAAFYIMQKKITRIPACVRCGGTFDQTAPEKLFNLDYVCPKCSAALARQEAFLRLMGA